MCTRARCWVFIATVVTGTRHHVTFSVNIFWAPISCLNGKMEGSDSLGLNVDKAYRRVDVVRSVL